MPEIALTPQSCNDQLISGTRWQKRTLLSVGERYDEWKRVKSGRAHLIIGTRSAVFAPTEDLGILIIDEEQEETYCSKTRLYEYGEDVNKYH